ncbi:hypothetical protein JRI60_08260 [Archangium violaceum]|uniref:hypothetical protein n=1 Tax=Archangium violaceum TaxID=83451 RepID=UPI00194F22A6|nr:hypothetical protein [Archangium violaceum]QRN99007.1 hypothetical protein JRI60_08260 [Archangium violaceum]
MPQPKPLTIVLILAVFACVALYVLGVGLGAQSGSSGSGSSLSKEQLGRWRERFVKPEPVSAEDLRATGCVVSAGTVRVSSTRPCVVDIAKADTRVRTVKVEPLSGSRVKVELRPKGGPALPVTVENLGEKRNLDVNEEGASLTLTCMSPMGGECPVRLR